MPSGLSQSHQEIAGQFQWELLQLICLGSGTHNRERLVDGRLRSTEGPIITSKWRARTAVEGAEVLTSDSEYEH